MSKATILLADNHRNFLETRSKILEKAGYRVLRADAPAPARRILESEPLNAAILDLRLVDDTDEGDISGLILAIECARHLPKIILTNFPSYEKALAALITEPGRFPPAVRFVEKSPEGERGDERMLRAVEEALKIGRKGFGLTIDEVSHQLNDDYQQARADAKAQTRTAGSISLLGMAVIFAGIGITLWRPETYPVGVAAATGGVVTEAVNYLFHRRADKSSQRVDHFHAELYQIKLLQTLIAAGEEFTDLEKREQTRSEILLRASQAWFKPETGLHSSGYSRAESEGTR